MFGVQTFAAAIFARTGSASKKDTEEAGAERGGCDVKDHENFRRPRDSRSTSATNCVP